MKKTNDRSEAPTPCAAKVCEKQIKKLQRHTKFDEIYGAPTKKSPEVQEILARYRNGEALRIPVVARVEGEAGYTILTGGLHVVAAEAAGLTKLLVQVVECSSPTDALARLIEWNQPQAKTLLDDAMEVFYLCRAHAKLAKERQQRAGGDRRSADAKKDRSNGSLPSDSDGTVQGDTREVVAKITRQSRERVELMKKLITKARQMDKANPRGTKIGKALAMDDADLKVIAREFRVVELPAAKAKSKPAARSATHGTKAVPGGAKSTAPGAKSTAPGAKSTAPGAKSTAPGAKSTARLLTATEHLADLEGDVAALVDSSLARATKRGRCVELLRALACSFDDAARRLLISTGGVDMDISKTTNRRGPAAVRDFLLKRIVGQSKAQRSVIAGEIGPTGKKVVTDLCKEKRELEPAEALAVIRALLTCPPQKP